MRTSQVHRAMAQDSNRFQLCRVVARGTRVSHREGDPVQKSIGNILEKLGALPIKNATTPDGKESQNG